MAGSGCWPAPPEDPARQLTIEGIEAPALAGFAEALSAHMAARTGERPRECPHDEAFPASARLSVSGDAVLNVYDDGDDFSIVVVADNTKAGTGTGAKIADVSRFAGELTTALRMPQAAACYTGISERR